MKKVTQFTAETILESIKQNMYAVGQLYVPTVSTDNLIGVRGANMAFRCAMLAIRDQKRSSK
jgi:hypothetical protein